MYKYVLKRLLLMIPIVLGVSGIIFFLISITPGDPATIILQGNASAEDVARLNHELGYDLPIYQRYINYMGELILHGNFGTSYVSGLPVLTELLNKAPVSAMVAFNAILFASIIGIPLGVLSAVKQYSLADVIPTFCALFLSSAPAFWIGLMLMQFFSVKLHLLPTGGIASLKSYILPMLTLGTPYAAEQHAGNDPSRLYSHCESQGCTRAASHLETRHEKCIASRNYGFRCELRRTYGRCCRDGNAVQPSRHCLVYCKWHQAKGCACRDGRYYFLCHRVCFYHAAG